MKTFKNEIAAMLDEGISLDEIIDLVRGYKEEYDCAHDKAIVEDIVGIFEAYGRSVDKAAIEKFVASTKGVVNCTEEKCACKDTSSEPEKIVEKKPMSNVATKDLPNGGKITVKTINKDADAVLAEWMTQLRF